MIADWKIRRLGRLRTTDDGRRKHALIAIIFITFFAFFCPDVFAYDPFPGEITVKLDTPQSFTVQQGQLYTVNAYFSWDQVTAQSIRNGFLMLYVRIVYPDGSVEVVTVTAGTFPMHLNSTTPGSATVSMWAWSVSPNPPNPDAIAYSITFRGLQNTTVALSQQALYYNGALTGMGGHGWGTIPVKFEYTEASVDHTLGLNGMHGESYTGFQAPFGTVLQVNHASGNLYHNAQIIFSNSANGYTSNLIASYNSRDDETTIFGKGWTYNFGMTVTGVSADTLRYKAWDGKRIEFIKTSVTIEDGHTVTSYSSKPSSGAHCILKEYKDQSGAVMGYILSKPNQEKEYFDAEGNLVKKEDINGNNVSVAYATDTVTITTSTGKITVINLTNGHVSSITGPNGQSATIVLTPDTQISTITIMDNGAPVTHTYSYNANSQMISYTTPENKTWQMEYASPPIKKITQPDLGIEAFSYNASIVEVTNTRGYKTIYTVDADLNVWREMRRNMTNPTVPPTVLTCVWIRDYDTERNLIREADAENNVSLTSYDANGNRISVTDPANFTEIRTYNPQNQVESILQKNGETVFFGYDAIGYNRTSEIDAEGNQTAYSYSETGEVLTQTNAKGVTTKNVYHDGNLVANVRNTNADTADCTLCHAVIGAPPKPFVDIQQSFNTVSPGTLNIIFLYKYNDQGFVTSRLNPKGYEEFYTLNIRGNRLTIQRTVTLQIDGLPQTVTITNSTEYNLDGYSTDTTDPMWHTSQYTRDYAGRVTYSTDAEGNISRTEYDTEGNPVKRWDSKGLINGNYYEYIYNEANLLTESTDPKWRSQGKKTLIEYNRNGLRIETVNAKGNSTNTEYNTRNLTSRTIDAKNNEINRTYNSMGGTDSVTDAKGNTTTFGFDKNNRQISVTDALQNIRRTFYDSTGNVEYTENARQFRTYFEYDAVNRRIAVIDALGERTETSYDANSNTIQIISKDNAGTTLAKSTFGYNELDWQTTSTEWKWEYGIGSVETAIGVTVTQIHNADGQVIQTIDPLGNVSNVSYDADHRAVSSEDALGNNEVSEYDKNSNVMQSVRTELYTDPQTGAVTAETFTITNSYNVLNQLISSEDNMGYVRQWAQDEAGNSITYTDAEGNVTDRILDELNRETETRQYLKDEAGVVIDTINVLKEYDENSNLLALTDDKGNRTEWTYDVLNRPEREIMPDGTVYKDYTDGYDANSNLAEWRDANGNVIIQQFDALDRLTRKDIQRGAGIEGTTFENYAYDGLSRMVMAQDDDSIVEFRYDSLSRKREEIQNGMSVKSDYNENGFRTALTYPNGRVVNYDPDELNRIDTISEGSEEIVDYNYAGASRARQRIYQPDSENPIVLNIGYNPNQWAESYVYTGAKTWYATEVDKKGKPKKYDWVPQTIGFAYDFDKEGNKKYEKFLHEGGKGDLFRYDSIYRLTGIKYGVQNPENFVGNFDGAPYADREMFNMDNVGNRTTVTNGTTSTYQTNNLNQYTIIASGSEAIAPLYDLNGNMTNDSYNTSIVYDYTNHPVRFNNADFMVEMRYDALGRRIEKKSTTKAGGIVDIEGYILDGARVISDADSAGAVQKDYIWGDGIDELLATAKGRSRKYDFYLNNSLGTITQIVNDKAEVQESYKYKVYGSVTIYDKKGEIANKSKERNRYMFTGREYEPEIKLYYYRARSYLPNIGKFIQKDIFPFSNRYSYVGNSPVNFVDPFGYWKIVRDETMLRGIAGAREGDSFEGLAKLVGLSDTELNGWLRKVSSISAGKILIEETLPLPNHPEPFEMYSFPNTVYVVVGDVSPRYASGVNPLSWTDINIIENVFLDKSLETLKKVEKEGYHAIYEQTTTRQGMLNILENSQNNAYIWGIAFYGHGERNEIRLLSDATGSMLFGHQIETSLAYGLGKSVINSCYSNTLRTNFLKGNNSNGIFKGDDGKIIISVFYDTVIDW